MTRPPSGQDQPVPGATLAGVGCVTAVAGFFSGGMVAVLVAKAVDFFTKAPKCPDVPSCHWLEYMLVGALIGALTLPTIAITRLKGRRTP